MKKDRQTERLGSILIILLLFLGCRSFADPVEQFRIKIVNEKDGVISIERNGAKEDIGHVIYPVNRVNERGFTASQWAGTSEIAATSVNAIHIKVKNDKTIFSILPREFSRSSDSSLYTDIPAGTKIFGGGYAPFVGNRAAVNGKAIKGPLNKGDVLFIAVERPRVWPKKIIFENKFGGTITVYYPDGSSEVVGQVLRPVQGVGRFEGSKFTPAGRIRANHPGVIDISTSVSGRVGGFQIIPAGHAQSPEMSYARIKTQWMVVSGLSVTDKTPEGMPPLFRYFLKPQYDPEDLNAADWENRLLKRFLVEVKLKSHERWKPMPVYGMEDGEDLPDDANRFLMDVEKIRILFPVNP